MAGITGVLSFQFKRLGSEVRVALCGGRAGGRPHIMLPLGWRLRMFRWIYQPRR